ncbi:MAG: hypothetical protein Kow00124_26640 [Anaerolineae bacterium]
MAYMLVERIRAWLDVSPRRKDLAAAAALTLLWGVFFWRVLTPSPADQVSLPEGDFTGIYFGLAGHAALRLSAGEIPLWNPYNYGGQPFIADPQSAVFYPVRLLTIAISQVTGGFTYATLQGELIAHVWLAAVLTYLFLRAATGSSLAGLAGAVIFAFGGYQVSYPPLQTTILEAGVWLPLALLGIYRASENDVGGSWLPWRAGWLGLSALALGLSLLAGHPQTSLYLTYALIAYIIHRAVATGLRWQQALLALVLVCGTGYALAAVQLLPGVEYYPYTIRTEFGFHALAGGFALTELIGALLPYVFSLWAPLYVGVGGLILAGVALWKKPAGAVFWGGFTLIALGLSFGGGTLLYRLAYLIVPGAGLFRNQERIAYLVSFGLAVLAALGVRALLDGLTDEEHSRLRRLLGVLALVGAAAAASVIILLNIFPNPEIARLPGGVVLLAALLSLAWIVIGQAAQDRGKIGWMPALVGLLVFDLFTLNMDTNWQLLPASQRQMTPVPTLVEIMQEDPTLFRVDGARGLDRGNFGSIFGLQDIWGLNPFRLAAWEAYSHLPRQRLHQLFAVKYVMTDWLELEMPSTIVATAYVGDLAVNLHEYQNPFPRAWMTYRVMVTGDDGQALGWLADPGFDPAAAVILAEQPPLDLPEMPPADALVRITGYTPERIRLEVETPADGVLVLSEMYAPGWRAVVDGEPVSIWRANAGLRALPLEAGQHRVEMTYLPTTFIIGAVISGLALLLILSAALVRGRKRA